MSKSKSEDDTAASGVNGGANILRIAVDGRYLHPLTLRLRSRNRRDARVVVLDLSFVQHNEFS